MTLLNCYFKQKHLRDRFLVAYKRFSNLINEVYELLFKHSHWRNCSVALFLLRLTQRTADEKQNKRPLYNRILYISSSLSLSWVYYSHWNWTSLKGVSSSRTGNQFLFLFLTSIFSSFFLPTYIKFLKFCSTVRKVKAALASKSCMTYNL